MWLKSEQFNHFKFLSIESTHLLARKLVGGGARFAIIRADEQTAGITTKAGSPWESPKGNLFWTMLASLPPGLDRRVPEISLATALAAVRAIRRFLPDDASICIKWPNDILVNKQKVAGILIEKMGLCALISIGVNVQKSPAAAVKYPTTCLNAAGAHAGPKDVAVAFEDELIKSLNQLGVKGFASVRDAAAPFLYRLGERVWIQSAGRNLEGVFVDLAENGGIIVETKDGEITLVSGELTKENFV
ncbi:MAG: biotin--[acetyl-CoA-carboxylase] ligase [Rickettsiales bacterium]|jgi:BirA family biotin operon repressor/biotin-[acetyl-CoA-carboxylase] ligase|nr:biotin--[acetyl-CoA-carboxylase] ligase [Rickettsiales bacterium]